MSDIEDLQKLAELKERGIITEGEFEKKKADIIYGQKNSPPAPKSKRRGFSWTFLAVIIGFIILIYNSFKSEDQPNSTSESVSQIPSTASAPEPSAYDRMRAAMPHEQKALLEAADAARQQYRAASNEMAQGASRPARARALCAALPGLSAANWVGRVYSLSTNSEGKGVLEIEIGPNTYVHTWNNSISDTGDKTLIDPSSALFATAEALHEGQLVRFSGEFIESKTDCLKESSLSLSGSIRSPEFLFIFRSLSPLT